MPARELGVSFEASNGGGSTLLKRHKTLPHPREERFIDLNTVTTSSKSRELIVDSGILSVTRSDTSSPRTLKHTLKRVGAPDLPPTPPTHSRQSSGSHPVITSAPRYDSSRSPSSTPSTPPNQKSPPTPDFTPPRALLPVPFPPPPSDRYPSSRTDSFKTARENPYSSDEDDLSAGVPILPSVRQSKDTISQIQKEIKRKEIGLGLGLESDNEGSTTPKGYALSQQEFVVFDGEWGSAEEASEVEREWDDNLMRNVTVRKRPGRNLHIFTDKPAHVLEDDIISPTMATRVVRSLPLQERIARHRQERDASSRKSTEKTAERIDWPLSAPDPQSPPTPDIRRFSEMSGRTNSTVVEAMVIDSLPLRKRTLRHTKKNIGLRGFSSEQSRKSSAPNSVASGDLHRLIHKTSRIPDRGHRSVASNATGSTTSSSKSRREVIKGGGIPVIVIPDRRSSTKSSKPPSLRSASSRKTRSMSLGSAPLSNSSKYNEPGYFDGRTRKRTQSESAGSGHSIRTIDYPPNIPARRSSLSAPTSRNTSRAGSLTTQSLEAHNMVQENLEKKPIIQTLSETKDETLNSHHLSVDHNGDPFFGTRPSTQATPFSQASYETAGTYAELSEAMAVTLFPHQNASVLVVQHAPDPSADPLKAINPSPPKPDINNTAIVDPSTPPQPSHPMDEVDSPLRNPRDAPEPPSGPPMINFIPPTPAGLTPSQEVDRQLEGSDVPTDKRKRALTLMRRAFSTRRSSEPAQKSGFLQRTFSLRDRRPESSDGSTQTSKGNANLPTLYPSVADQPADGSKLHPFWRPTHFWDDLEEYDFDAYDELRYPPIDNRPTPPKRTLSGKLKRTFAILPMKDEKYDVHPIDRRIMRRTEDGMRVVKQRSNSSLNREVDRSRFWAPGPNEFGYVFKEGKGGRIHTIPGLGVRVEYVGWSGIKRRLSERRREQRSEKLRASISMPRKVQSGVDDVLRRS